VQLMGWIGLCLLATVLLRRHLTVLVIAVLVVWAAVPAVASSVVTGVARAGALGFHPATWLILLTLAVQLLHDPHGIGAEIARRIFTYLALSLFLAVAFLATRTSAEGGGLVLFLSQMLAPIALFLLVNVALSRDFQQIYWLRNAVLAIAAVQSVLAIIEFQLGTVLLYRAYYETQYWYDEVKFPRWMGTLDHPLTLSLLLCAAIPLLAGIRAVWVQLPLLLLMAAGVLATQSRTGLVVAVVAVIYVLVTSRIHPVAKVFSLLVVGIVGAIAATSALSAGVVDRLASDGGSAGARTDALDFVVTRTREFLFTGGGIGSSYQAADLGGLSTSLESSVLIYAVDIGIVFALLYFGTQLVIVIRSFGRSSVPGLALAGLAMIIVPQTYNALGAQTFAAILLWTVLAMAATMTSERAARRALDIPPEEELRTENLRRWAAAHPVAGSVQ
jgi:hypothetical protein